MLFRSFSAVEWLKENNLNTLSLNLQNFVCFGCLNVLPQLLNKWVLKKKVRMSRYHLPRPWPYSMNKKTVEKNNMEGDLRKDKHIIRGKRAVKIYNSNSDYRYLFVCIADLFAKLLKSDIEYLKLGVIEKISLASKWCPSLDSLEDQRTLLCEGIARWFFPRLILSIMILMRLIMLIGLKIGFRKRFLSHSERLWECQKVRVCAT